MAKKVTELLEEVLLNLNSKIAVETAEQSNLQALLDETQAKLTASQAELTSAESALSDIAKIK